MVVYIVTISSAYCVPCQTAPHWELFNDLVEWDPIQPMYTRILRGHLLVNQLPQRTFSALRRPQFKVQFCIWQGI